jgi:hypothetical protein
MIFTINDHYYLHPGKSTSSSIGLIIATLYLKVYDGNQMVTSTFDHILCFLFDDGKIAFILVSRKCYNEDCISGSDFLTSIA